ncbi:MAG: flagellar filament capping protein FliD [Lachnotalea sp.]
MTIRMTGMASGLDTDSIITELMKAQRTKIDSVEKKKTTTEWKTDAWSTLNTKVYALYTGSLSEMRFSANYNKKAATISDSTIATVTANSTAVDGTQELVVKSLAKSGYLTGGSISTSDSSTLSSSSTLSKLTGYAGTGDGTLEITVGTKTSSITVNSSSTISNVVAQLKSAGVNASFDATNKRIFVSSTTSGAAADFSITGADAEGADALDILGLSVSSTTNAATKIAGQDAEITLNGATFTSASNTFSINGLSIVATEVSDSSTVSGNTVYSATSISISRDYQATYDTIKDFFTEYNTLINEMDSLYNADSAKGYEPLTDDEKDSMTDTQIEDWETKIKDALLRKDSNLGTVSTAMKKSLYESYKIDGTIYSLASFGIATGSYFNTDSDEHNAYHIDGNSDDSTVSNNTDKLMAAIKNDPDKVMNFFATLTKGLYTKVGDNMKSITGVRTSYKVYDDQTLDSQIDDYEDKINKLEDKFTAMEDRYYSQFSAMETALTKLQSSSSALTSLLGSS